MSALQQISHNLRSLGVALPKPLADAQAAAAKFLQAVPKTDREPGNPIGVALDEIEAGRDPYGPDVQRQAVMYQLTELNLPNAARLRAEGRLDDALAVHADAVLTALAERLQGPAEAMATAHQLGIRNLADARAPRRQQLSAWGNAAEAVDAFAIAQSAVIFLFRAIHRAPADKLRVLANAGPGELQQVRNRLLADNTLSPAWVLTQHGIDVAHIRSVTELQQRERRIDGVVEPLEADDKHTKRPRAAAVSS